MVWEGNSGFSSGYGGAATYGGGSNPGPVPMGGGGTGYGDVWNLFQTGILNPVNAQADQTLANLGLQQGLLNANYGVQSGQIQQQGQSGLANIGISEGALARQQQLEPQMADLQRQLFGISGDRIGLSREGLGVQREGTSLQRAIAQFQSEQAGRGAWSGATARGATNTSGFGQTLSDIGTSLQQRLAGIGLQDKNIGLQERGLGLSEQELGIGKQKFELSEQEKMAQLTDAASRLGLDKSDLQNRVSSALNKLGLDQALGTVDIIKAINDVQAGRYNALTGVLGQISQIDPRLLQGGVPQQQAPAAAPVSSDNKLYGQGAHFK